MKYLLISDDATLKAELKGKIDPLDHSGKDSAIGIISKIQTDKKIRVVLYHIKEPSDTELDQVRFILTQVRPGTVVFLIANEATPYKKLVKDGVADIFTPNTKGGDIVKRAEFILKQQEKPKYEHPNNYRWKGLPFWKRGMDITLSLMAIIVLLPLFLIVALAIRLESKGKVFYAAKRVGTGFKIFPFYKFRSMYMDADKRVEALMAQNQYAGVKDAEFEQMEALKESKPKQESPAEETMLMTEEDFLPEEEFLKQKKDKEENAFFKMANDPRITKVGKFIRNTSIDELPQLFNILKGDMSIVGNRPLPLYEAELLTNNEWSQRFLAPAGLTGLWQVTTRGKGKKLSADERKQLDIDYANNYTFWGDVMIILKTIPALLQEENV